VKTVKIATKLPDSSETVKIVKIATTVSFQILPKQ
jgi:hypothetical protein